MVLPPCIKVRSGMQFVYIMAGFQQPSYIPVHLWKELTTENAFSCTRGGYQSIRHNEIHDLTAMLLTE